jgi:hypothetical protein
MKMTLKPLLCGICLAAGLALRAGAVPVVYDITVDHASGGLGPAPFGTVSLNQNGSGVDFIVHINTGFNYVLTGAADFMDFKFNATGVALSDITITQNAPKTLIAQTGSFNGDGTGQFGFGITGDGQKNGGAGKFSSDIKFNVANSTISDFTTANNLGFLFVVDILSPNGNTGPAAVQGPPRRQVPDGGSTAALLGAGLLGVGAVRRKLGKKA